jgi:hypothetical protein
MPSLDSVVNFSILTASSNVSRLGFGRALILGASNRFSDLTRVYGDLASMIADGFLVNDPEYLAASSLFAQNPKPVDVKIGKRNLPPTMAWTVTPVASPLAAYTLHLAYGDATYQAIADDTVALIIAGLKAAIDALATAPSAWVKNHAYVVGDLVTQGHRAYRCITAGTSQNSDSPVFDGTSTASDITDGSVHWSFILNAIAMPWVGSLGFLVGQTCTNDSGKIYKCTKAGTSASSGGPTGTTGAIADGTCKWDYVGCKLTTTNNTTTLGIAAPAAGLWGRVSPDNINLIGCYQSNTDGGIASDLNAIILQDTDWYGLISVFSSPAEVLAAATWVEANQKLFATQTQDTRVVSSSTLDIASTLFSDSFARSFPIFHPDNAEFSDAAWFGACLPLDPGSETWCYHTLAGVAVTKLTLAQQNYATGTSEASFANGKACNIYVTIGGQDCTFPGLVSAREFIDKIRGCDWYRNTGQTNVFSLFVERSNAGSKVPYTDEGIAAIKGRLASANSAAVQRGFFASDPAPYVRVPKAADIDSITKKSRRLTQVVAGGTIAGAIHELTVVATLTY